MLIGTTLERNTNMSAFDDLIHEWTAHITRDDLPPFWPTTRAFQTALIYRAVHLCDGNQAKAAQLLGIKRTTLVERLKCAQKAILERDQFK